jgi:beta-glucosidase-like glycosyl hydrolase
MYRQDLLRYELDYHGFLVTDYGEINGLHGEHAIARDNREAVKIAMRDTSIDMSMTAWDTNFATDLMVSSRVLWCGAEGRGEVQAHLGRPLD